MKQIFIDNQKVSAAFFDRHGGVSSSPFDSKNVGLLVGDTPENVAENRQRIKKELDIDYLVSAKQVHGDAVYCLSDSVTDDNEVGEYDGLITNQPNVGLLIQQADCQSVLLYDPVHQAIGAIHSGWRGSVINIIEKCIVMMGEKFSSRPEDIMAGIGPSLGPCCGEFINYKDELPESFHPFQVRENHFDFWQISKMQLMDCGLKESAIMIDATCTVCDNNYFSYRRACRESGGVCGRHCSIIALR